MTFFKKVSSFIVIMFVAVSWTTAATEINAPLSHKADSHIRTNSNAAISSNRLSDTPSLFQTEFNKSTWSGNLKKIGIKQHTDGSLLISKEVQWDASSLLSTKQAPANRTITTFNPSTEQTVAFEFKQLPADTQTLFAISPSTKKKDDLGRERVNYLRGERTMESKNPDPATPQFRRRDSVLGDIIQSAPIYVGAPAKSATGSDYSSFFERYKNRPGTVFVGANDGMLHAFSADSGTELFAYIPSPILKKLPRLTDPAYQHEALMDGNLSASEALVSGQWKTILAAGMGHGAKGVFALDVTAPDKFMMGKRALFEFTEKHDADIGYITSSPSIAKISIGKNKDGSINYRYFVVVTSGIDAHDTSVTNSSDRTDNSEQFLFLLSLDKDPSAPWFRNSNYFKINVNSHNPATNNALSAPGLVTNAQGAAIYAYAGDLQGNVWRFDFTGDNPDSIAPKLLFTAKDKNNNPQAITTQPMVSFAPSGGHLVLFGTGENSESAKGRSKQNSFYALRDTAEEHKEDYFINDRANLAARELVTNTIRGKSGLQVTGHEFSYSNSQANKKGWYIDYQRDYANGYQKRYQQDHQENSNNNHSSNQQCDERSIFKGELAFGSIFFNTVTPSGAMCNEAGTSISYVVDAITGKSDNISFTALKSQVGRLGTPLLVTAKQSLGERDSTGRRFNTQQYFVLNTGSGGINGSFEITDSGKATLKAGRLSWREISNWQDRTDKNELAKNKE